MHQMDHLKLGVISVLLQVIKAGQAGAAQDKDHGEICHELRQARLFQEMAYKQADADHDGYNAEFQGLDLALGRLENAGVLAVLDQRHTLLVAGGEKHVNQDDNRSECADNGQNRDHYFNSHYFKFSG
jgi:hypothetical protein